MTKSEIPSLIDSVEIGEMKVALVSSEFRALTMEAKYALVISKSGVRLGAGTRQEWSDETKKRLRELLDSMELDICEDVFGQSPTTGSGGATDDPHGDGVPGL